MNSNPYWVKRDLVYQSILNKAKKRLGQEYSRCAKSTKLQVINLYVDILEKSMDGTLLASDLYRYNRYFELTNNLNQELTKLGLQEEKIIEANLISMYNQTKILAGTEVEFIPIIDNEQTLKAINTIWCADNKVWSQRIWTNKTALQDKLTAGIVDCITRGTSKDALIETLMDNFNQGFYNSSRLVRTELAYVQNKGCVDTYIEAGIEEYEWLDTSDERCCDECHELNGQRFPVTDTSHIPPTCSHANCRCAILAVINK